MLGTTTAERRAGGLEDLRPAVGVEGGAARLPTNTSDTRYFCS